MMENDVTPYKYIWTTSGLELLANIQKEMIRWEGMPDDALTHCSKANCAFCNYVAPIYEPEHTVLMQSRMNDMPTIHAWSDYDSDILLTNIGTQTRILLNIFPDRTESSIESRKSILRKRYNIPTQARQWDKHGFISNNKYLNL